MFICIQTKELKKTLSQYNEKVVKLRAVKKGGSWTVWGLLNEGD